MTLRVMTWNLWWRFGPWEQRRHAISATIRAADPDIVCLQEVWADADGGGLAHILGDELGYHSVNSVPIGRSDIGFSNAVLSRWPSTPLADEALPRVDGTPDHRRIVAASVHTPWGRWPIASTHLDHRFDDSAVRQIQCRRLLELASVWRGDPAGDLPLIVGADLNAVADSAEVRMLTGREPAIQGIVFSDVWEQTGEGAGPTWRRDNPYTNDTAWPNRRIDYVLVSWPRPKPVGNPIAAHLVGTDPVDLDGVEVWASDHAGIVADITTPL
jgi:endonuclease/exonuclease/phosphatase family metal-dependent hydrolase